MIPNIILAHNFSSKSNQNSGKIFNRYFSKQNCIQHGFLVAIFSPALAYDISAVYIFLLGPSLGPLIKRLFPSW